jgi:prepilin-type N-terminal cleavage/methylation domain-containing protein
MTNTKGFTLIELAVVLAIIAVLAAVLTPLVTNYVDQARVSRAMADAKTIANSVNLYKRDTGYYPIYMNLADAKAGTTDVSGLVSIGNPPGIANSATGWNYILTSGVATTDLITHALNTPFSGLSSNDNNPGKASYRGPYIGALDSDPWGNQFVITANNLRTGTDRAFVISAGADGTIQTNANQGLSNLSAANGSDDIIVPIN